CARSVSFTATAPPALSTLSLHDALPILNNGHVMQRVLPAAVFLCHLVVAFQHGMVGVQKRLLQGSCIGSVALKVVPQRQQNVGGDRKSTRLNSSHVSISYAVFCLKKKIV